MAPSNHRQTEEKLIRLVWSGEWSVDDEGRVWRLGVRRGGRWTGGRTVLVPCGAHRAEHRVPLGYLQVRSMVDGVRVYGMAHRLVWRNLHGVLPDGLTINHRNGVKDDNRPENLELATYSQQQKHAYRMGLSKSQAGEHNNQAKLTDAQVAAIRAERSAGGSLLEIAGRYGVSFQHVSRLALGEQR